MYSMPALTKPFENAEAGWLAAAGGGVLSPEPGSVNVT